MSVLPSPQPLSVVFPVGLVYAASFKAFTLFLLTVSTAVCFVLIFPNIKLPTLSCTGFNLLSSVCTFNKCVLLVVILFELCFFTNGYFHFPCNPIQGKGTTKTENNYRRAQTSQ